MKRYILSILMGLMAISLPVVANKNPLLEAFLEKSIQSSSASVSTRDVGMAVGGLVATGVALYCTYRFGSWVRSYFGSKVSLKKLATAEEVLKEFKAFIDGHGELTDNITGFFNGKRLTGKRFTYRGKEQDVPCTALTYAVLRSNINAIDKIIELDRYSNGGCISLLTEDCTTLEMAICRKQDPRMILCLFKAIEFEVRNNKCGLEALSGLVASLYFEKGINEPDLGVLKAVLDGCLNMNMKTIEPFYQDCEPLYTDKDENAHGVVGASKAQLAIRMNLEKIKGRVRSVAMDIMKRANEEENAKVIKTVLEVMKKDKDAQLLLQDFANNALNNGKPVYLRDLLDIPLLNNTLQYDGEKGFVHRTFKACKRLAGWGPNFTRTVGLSIDNCRTVQQLDRLEYFVRELGCNGLTLAKFQEKKKALTAK